MLFRSNDTATTEIYTLLYTLSLHALFRSVFDQAENRLHTQKALLSWLLTGSADPS